MPENEPQIPSLAELRRRSMTKEPSRISSEDSVPKKEEKSGMPSLDDIRMKSMNPSKKKESTDVSKESYDTGLENTPQYQSDLTNQPKTKQQISSDVKKIVSDNIQGLTIQSTKDKKDFRPIIKGAESGDPESISLLRNKISGLYDQQINDIQKTATVKPASIGLGMGVGVEDTFVLSDQNKAKISELQKKKKEVVETLNKYGSYSTTNYFKKISGGNIDKVDYEGLGRTYDKHFGSPEKTRLENLALKAKVTEETVDVPNMMFGVPSNNLFTTKVRKQTDAENRYIKIANDNIKFKYTSIGLNAAIEDAESEVGELQSRVSADPSVKPELDKKKNDLSKLYGKRKNLVNDFPEVRRQYMAEVIGNEIAEQKGNFNLFVSKKDIDNAYKALKKKNATLPQGAEEDVRVLKDRTGEGVFGETSPVPLQGFLGSYVRHIAHPNGYTEEIEAAGKVMFENSAFMKGTEKSGQSPQVMTISKDGTAYIPKDNKENYGHFGINNVYNILGGAIPTVAPFVATELVTGGVGGLIEGLSGVGKLVESGAMSAKTLNFAKEELATTAAFFATGYQENYDSIGDLIPGEDALSSAKRVAGATMATLGDRLAFGIVGTNMSKVLKNSISRSAVKDVVQFINEKGIEDLSKKEVFGLLEKAYVPRILNALGSTAKKSVVEGGKMSIASALQTAFKDAVKTTIDPDVHTATAEEYKNAMVQGAIMGVGMSLPGHLVNSIANPPSKMNRDALVDAGQNSDKYIKQINDSVESGTMDRVSANNAIKIIQTAREEVNNPENKVSKDGKRLSDRQFSKIIAEQFVKRAADILPDKIQKDQVRAAADKRIEEIKSQDTWVNIDETPIIKELNIKPVDVEKGGELKSFKDIDAGEKYTVKVDGEEKEMSGADVIELINEKATTYEEVKDTESEVSQTQKGEGGQAEGKIPEIKIEDKDIIPTLKKVEPYIIDDTAKSDVVDVMSKINNAEYINEKDLGKAADHLYDLLDKHSDDPSLANLIEPLINKIEGYEFATKTETRTITEKVPVEVARPTRERKAVSKSLEQWEGNRAIITGRDGKSTEGTIKSENGKYYLFNQDGEKVAVLGEKAITDRNITLPSAEDVPMPIETDAEGNVKSITLQLNEVDLEKGGLTPTDQIKIDFKDPEKALDFAIQLRAEQVGEIPETEFETVYQEIQKEIQEEVPVKDLSSQSKTTQDGKKDGQGDVVSQADKGGSGKTVPPLEAPTKDDLTPTVVVNGKEYSGENHGEAMNKAIAAGEDIPSPDTKEGEAWRDENGMFKDKEGNLLNREQTEEKYGIRNSEELLPSKTEVQQPAENKGAKPEGSNKEITSTEEEQGGDSETDPLEVSLQRDMLKKTVQDEFFKPENGEKSIGDEVVMNNAINTLSQEATAAGKSVLVHLSDKINEWYNELFNPETGDRKLDRNGRQIQKVLTDEELAMLGVHSLELAKKIRDTKLDPTSNIDAITLEGLLSQQEQLQRLTAALTEAAGRGFRFIQQIYKFGDQGEYQVFVKMADRLVGANIPIEEEAFQAFKSTLSKGQQNAAQIAHDALVSLKEKYDAIDKKRAENDRNAAKLTDAEVQRLIQKAVEEGIKQGKKEAQEEGKSTSVTDKSGRVKKGAANKIADSLDKIADYIEKNNTLGGNLPEGTQAMGITGGKNFSKAVADGIKRIAQKIRDLGGKIPDLIEDEVSLLIKDGFDEDAARKAVKQQLKEAGVPEEAINALPKREELVKKIVEASKNSNTNKITKEAVKKGLIRDLATEVALRGEPVEKVADKVVELLKEKGIETDRDDYNAAFMREGAYKIEKSIELESEAKKVSAELRNVEQEYADLSKLDEQIQSVEEAGTINKEKKPVNEKELNLKVAAKEHKLKDAMIKKGIKFERGSKDSQAAKKGVLEAHNDSVKEFGKKITEMLNKDAFGTSKVEGLKNFLRGLESKLTKNIDSTELKTQIKEASLKVEKAINEFNREHFKVENRADANRAKVLSELQKLQRDLKSNDTKTSEQIALDRYKKRMTSEIDEYMRKRAAGEFDDTKKNIDLKKDSEANNLFILKEKAKLDFVRAMDAAKDAKAKQSLAGKIYIGVRGFRSITGRMIVSGLGNIQSKLAFSALTRRVTPLSRALASVYTKILGLEKSVIQESYNPKAMWKGYRETIATTSDKKANEMLAKSSEDFEKSLDLLNDAEDKYARLLYEGKTEEAAKFSLNELSKAKNDYQEAAMNDAINFPLHKMHPNAWKGRMYIFEKGLNKQEELTGMFGKRESIQDVLGPGDKTIDFGDDVGTFNKTVKKANSKIQRFIRAGLFYGNMTTRSHSVWKDIPSRQATVEGYMKRLEYAQQVLGEDISDYSIKNRIWHEAVATDGQAAKFQDKNKLVDLIRDLQSVGGKTIMKAGGNEYVAKTVDEIAYMTTQVLKVPMNIAKVKVFQYQLGSMLGTFDALSRLSQAKKEGLGFSEYMKTLDPKYSDRIVSALSKGTVGIASSILVGAMTMQGQYISGGTYPDPKKKGVKLADGSEVDLEYGDIVMFGHKLRHWVAVGWGHTLLGYTMEMGNFIVEEAMKKGEKGEQLVERWMDGLLEAGKLTVSGLPLPLQVQRQPDRNHPGETKMQVQMPFQSIGYFGAVKDIEAGVDLLKDPENRTKYAKQYQMTVMEGLAFRSGLLWFVPTEEEAMSRIQREKEEKENRAWEYQNKNE